MNKILMSFKIDTKIKQKIERISRKRGLSASSLINIVLADYIEEKEIKAIDLKNKRKWISHLWNKIQQAHSLEEVDKIFKEATDE